MRALKFLAWCFLFLNVGGSRTRRMVLEVLGRRVQPRQPRADLVIVGRLVLPASARNVQAQEEELMVLWVLGRFDLPDEDLAALLANTPRTAKLFDVHPDSEMHDGLRSLDGMSAWWRPGELRDPRCRAGRYRRVSGRPKAEVVVSGMHWRT